MKAIEVIEFGGPEALTLREVPDPEPAEGHVLVDVRAAGVNFADALMVANRYPPKPTELPFVPGLEAAGLTPEGRRVVAIAQAAYAERALVPEALSAEVPDGVEDGQALALMIQGLTAWHVLRDSAALEAGESVLIHAGAGGVGSLAVQLAKRFGAGRVVATASTPEKRELAARLGADAAVDSTSDTLEDDVRAANGGRPFDVVLEMVGGETFAASLRLTATFGRLVTFGAAGGAPPPPVEPSKLTVGCKGVLGFWLMPHLDRGVFARTVPELLRLVADGELEPVVGASYPLAEARRAHEDLLGRRSTGKLVLVP